MSPTALATPIQVDTVANLKAAPAAVTEADLRQYSHFDSTTAVGTEFRGTSEDGKPVLSIGEVLADQSKLKALGRLVSERGVVFFRKTKITPEEQRTLVDELGRLGGKPATSRLHVHPCTSSTAKDGDEIAVISNKFLISDDFKRPNHDAGVLERPYSKIQWHSDITYEPVPSDYACLVIRTLPPVGGDTLWASAYEAYDRLSPAMQTFLDGLTAEHRGEQFVMAAKHAGLPLREPRGAPENVGQTLTTIHPVIRTNPVTGWKGLFVNRIFTKRIVELSLVESELILDHLFDLISDNHDLQVRFRWEEDSLAIWDNRSTFHAATPDVGEATREGSRSVSLGERPYFDPKSVSRQQALAQKQ